MDYDDIVLKVPIKTCIECQYPYVPTENNEKCLVCIRGIDRLKLVFNFRKNLQNLSVDDVVI